MTLSMPCQKFARHLNFCFESLKWQSIQAAMWKPSITLKRQVAVNELHMLNCFVLFIYLLNERFTIKITVHAP